MKAFVGIAFCLLATALGQDVQISFESSLSRSGQRYGCPGDPVLLLCRFSGTTPDPNEGLVDMFLRRPGLNTIRYPFFSEHIVITTDGISASLILNRNGERVTSVIFPALPATSFSLECSYNSSSITTEFLISGLPGAPENTRVEAYQVNDSQYIAVTRWDPPSNDTSDIDFYEVEVEGVTTRLRRPTEQVTVFDSPPPDRSIVARVVAVNKCGMTSTAGSDSTLVRPSQIIVSSVMSSSATSSSATSSSATSSSTRNSSVRVRLGGVSALVNILLILYLTFARYS